MREYGTNDEPSECIHGEAGWCALCVGPTRTAESMGLPMAVKPGESDPHVMLAIVGLIIALAACGGIAVWLF